MGLPCMDPQGGTFWKRRALWLPGLDDFAEIVFAASLAIGKYWWLSGKTSLGLSLLSGIYGFTLTEGKMSSIGWSVGLGLAFLFG